MSLADVRAHDFLLGTRPFRCLCADDDEAYADDVHTLQVLGRHMQQLCSNGRQPVSLILPNKPFNYKTCTKVRREFYRVKALYDLYYLNKTNADLYRFLRSRVSANSSVTVPTFMCTLQVAINTTTLFNTQKIGKERLPLYSTDKRHTCLPTRVTQQIRKNAHSGPGINVHATSCVPGSLGSCCHSTNRYQLQQRSAAQVVHESSSMQNPR